MTEASIIARLERLPISSWHVKIRFIVGTATFFDGFDYLSIAIVLPALVGPWHISPHGVGALISISYAGQVVGTIFFGWLAGQIGRVNTLRICIAVFGLMSLACATASNYDQLFAYRFFAGIGLGGEVPIAAAYISEIAQASRRGAFVLLYELVFVIGLASVSFVGAWLIPRFGWQSLFAVGSIPTILAVFMQRYCPESPRWLASRGRIEEAERVLARIETAVSKNRARALLEPVEKTGSTPGRADWRDLFQQVYRRRTISVWAIWGCSYLVSSLSFWLPTLYRTNYHLSLPEALDLARYTVLGGVIGNLVCALTVDRIGRRQWFIAVFAGATVCCFALLLLGVGTLAILVTFGILITTCMSIATFSLYLYTAEIYPTRIRGIGVSLATVWARASTTVGPVIIGWILPNYGPFGLFVFLGLVATAGLIACIWGVVEGKGMLLEDLSP